MTVLAARLRTLIRSRSAREASAEEIALLEEVAAELGRRERRQGPRYVPDEGFKKDVAAAFEEANTLRRRTAALEQVVEIIHLYSRRYCDGRSTYAPDDHNRATHTLLGLGVTLPADPISTTGPFARDGMYGLMERELDVLAATQAGGDS